MTLLESPDRGKDIPQQKPTRVSFLIFLQFWKKEEEKEVTTYQKLPTLRKLEIAVV